MDNGGFVDPRFEAAVAVVVLGHGCSTRGPEEVFDLMVRELAHEAGEEAPPLFADGGITEAIVCGEALVQGGLALAGRAFGSRFLPEALAGPVMKIHFGAVVAGEHASAAP